MAFNVHVYKRKWDLELSITFKVKVSWKAFTFKFIILEGWGGSSLKSGAYIASIISEVIDEIGEKNVLQVVMDNAANCRSAGRILEHQYPRLYASGCNTHSLNLVL